MATGADLRRIALSLDGTTEAPHFDRAAFKVARTYVTLAADGRTANFKFTPDEQELKCLTAPDAFSQIPNAWGKQGWTTCKLARLSGSELKSALETAWQHALPKPKQKR
jgi:YjbR